MRHMRPSIDLDNVRAEEARYEAMELAIRSFGDQGIGHVVNSWPDGIPVPGVEERLIPRAERILAWISTGE